MATGVTSRPRSGYGRARVGPLEVLGELVLTLGVVAMLLVGYELYFSNVISAVAQGQAAADLDRQWQEDGLPVQAGTALTHLSPPADGQAFAKLYLPTIGDEYTVVQGTTLADLGKGPGHYVGSAMPGELGNLAIAGHRVGHGAPFTDIDGLVSCAPLLVETRNAWSVYRVLPMPDEVARWGTEGGARPRCTGVRPPDGAYQGVVGQQIVTPDRGDVILPVPGRAGQEPPGLALITLTSCNPKFSARQRLIVHGVLTRVYAKDPAHLDMRPTELDES